MKDVEMITLMGAQFNRISRSQLEALGFTKVAIEHRLRNNRLAGVAEGVFAIPPVLDDDWGRWMAATLTSPGSYLNLYSAAGSYGVLDHRLPYETVVRPGSGGPRRFGNVVAYRSSTLEGETAELRGIPITSMPRTLLDLARCASDRALARGVRESIRLKHTTVAEFGDYLGRTRTRSGARRLAAVLGRYRGLPLERARSGAEIRALEVLRAAGIELPRLNIRVAGEEADLSWPRPRAIIEIDGRPFHQDAGQDERKARAWRDAGWKVKRIPSDDVYGRPALVITLARSLGVPICMP